MEPTWQNAKSSSAHESVLILLMHNLSTESYLLKELYQAVLETYVFDRICMSSPDHVHKWYGTTHTAGQLQSI